MCLAKIVRKRIDDRVRDLTRKDLNGEDAPYVCCVCDHMLKRKSVCGVTSGVLEKNKEILTPKDWNAVNNDELERYYKYPCSRLYGYKPFMKDMMLSPRSSRVQIGNRQLYTCCTSCKYYLGRNKMPVNAIANNNFVGKAPNELLELNPVELAFLSPTKAYGYCFVWQGGKQICLKGSLGFYQVETRSLSRSIGQLWSLGAKVVVLMTGKMTQG